MSSGEGFPLYCCTYLFSVFHFFLKLPLALAISYIYHFLFVSYLVGYHTFLLTNFRAII